MAPPPPAPDPPDQTPQTPSDPLPLKQRPLSSGSDSGYSGSSGGNPDHLAPSGSSTSLAVPMENPEDEEIVKDNKEGATDSTDNGACAPLILINGSCTEDPYTILDNSTIESSQKGDSVSESMDKNGLSNPPNTSIYELKAIHIGQEMIVLPERFRRNRNRRCAEVSSMELQCTCNHVNHGIYGDSQEVNKEHETTPGNICSCPSDVITNDHSDVNVIKSDQNDVNTTKSNHSHATSCQDCVVGAVTGTSCPDCGGSLPPPGRPVEGEEGGNHDDKMRRQDVSLALQWLKQQMLLMKEQDKVLMRQFLELRASIHGLRRVPLSPSSATDLSTPSYPSSTTNPSSSLPWLLKQGEEEAPILQGLRGDECEVEFRARTVSMVPPRPRGKLQIRSFSKEFV